MPHPKTLSPPPSLLFSLLSTLVFLVQLGFAIEVTPGSPCSNFCIDRPGANTSDPISSATFSRDLSCLDGDYAGENSTAVGRKFRSCVGCQQQSGATGVGMGAEEADDDGTQRENDVYWFLFNLKSTVAWCATGFFEAEQNPNATLANTVCGAACAEVGVALGDRLKQTNETLQYNYCGSDGGAFGRGVGGCKACLGGTEGLGIMANFLDALVAACEQRPGPGETLDLSTSVFALASVASSSPEPSTRSSAGASAPARSGSSSLPTGGIVGIVIGAVAFLFIGAVAILVLGRRRKYGIRGRGGLDGVAGRRRGELKQQYREMEAGAFPKELDAGGEKPGVVQMAPVELPTWTTNDARSQGNGGSYR